MSRSRAQSGLTISLFPFLAVLLCTMGALLVLLVLFSRSAQRNDTAAAEAARQQADQQARGELEAARDELAWRIDQMRAVRDRTADELAKARMQLAGTEEDARKLADELDALGRTAEALEDAAADDAGAEAILELERRLVEAKKALDEAKDATSSAPPAYAVVPFEGPTGTHRRPLYIECCIDGVFLQPEGIRLGPADFEGPPGPGNPLASALRAAREHIARSPGESGDPNVQPYPLLLVRPSGVMAYYAARESIQSWGSEFGYQFIDEEWTLTFPPRDAALAEAEMRAVEEARRRLEWLAQVRPVKKSAKPATQYRASTTRGGVVSSSGPSVLGDQSRFDWTEQQAGGSAGSGGPGRGFVAGGSGAASGDGAPVGSDAGGGDVILGPRGGSGAVGSAVQGSVTAGDMSGGNGNAGAGEFADVGSRYSGPSKFYASSGGGGGPGGPAAGDGTQDGGEAGVGSQAGAASQANSGSRRHGSSEAGGGPSGGSAADGGSASGNAGGGQQADGAAGGGGAAGMASSSGGASGGGGSGPSMPGLHQPGGGSSAGGMSGASSASAGASLAGRRGSNWASLATNDNPVPLTRPIKLECSADEFRILGDGGRVQSRIPIGTHTVDSIDPLVREVHATVGGWGLAGDRMYWKPELVLSATPDGIGRREDLEKLLADSGMDTRRSEHREKVRNLPPVQRTGSLFPRR